MPFPWTEHRTLAEVAETRSLLRRIVLAELVPGEQRVRLNGLLAKERRHNAGHLAPEERA